MKDIRISADPSMDLTENRYAKIAAILRRNGNGFAMLARNLFRRKSVIERNIRFDTSMQPTEDYDFSLTFLAKASKVITADIYSYYYRLDRTSSLMNNKSSEDILSYFQVFSKWFDIFKELKGGEISDGDIDFLMSIEADSYITFTALAGRYKKAEMKMLIEAFMKRPDILEHGASKISRLVVKMYKIFGIPFTAKLISIPWMKPLLVKIIMTLNAIKHRKARQKPNTP